MSINKSFHYNCDGSGWLRRLQWRGMNNVVLSLAFEIIVGVIRYCLSVPFDLIVLSFPCFVNVVLLSKLFITDYTV